MSMKNYLTVLLEALRKKNNYLDDLYKIACEQEQCLGSEAPDINRLKELVTKRKEIVAEIDKLDDGFVSVYERVADELQKQPSEYADIIKNIQELIQKIMEQTNKIKVKDIRIEDSLKAKHMSTEMLGAAGGFSTGNSFAGAGGYAAKSVAGKYNTVMKNSGAGNNQTLGSTFIDKKN